MLYEQVRRQKEATKASQTDKSTTRWYLPAIGKHTCLWLESVDATPLTES
jgi:hypothetical protein